MANDDRNRWGRPTQWGGDEEAFGGGWGNQRPHAQRLGDRSHHGPSDDLDADDPRYLPGGGEPYGSRDFGPGGTDPNPIFGAPGYDAGFGGPRFDRVDVGSIGTHGAHPVASASGEAHLGGFGAAGGFGGSSARRYAMLRRHSGADRDPNYSQWRDREVERLDRDYDEYCRERQSRFDDEFGAWREQRGRQRESLSRAREHMEVIGADGGRLGTVERVDGDRLILARGESSGGAHHVVPCSWVERIDEHVHLDIAADKARERWRDEDNSRALFERPRHGEEGPHMLNRSFSGTYGRHGDDR